MYFYVLFALLLPLKWALFLPLLSLVLLCGAFAGFTGGPYPAILHVVTSPMLLEFLAGCLIGSWYIRCIDSPKHLGAVLLVSGLLLLVLSGVFGIIHVPRIIKWGIPAALVVFGALLAERHGIARLPSLPIKLGDSSYSLYLSHIFTISAVGKIWITLFGSMYGLFIVVATLASIAVGHLSYVMLERPVTRYLNAIYRNRFRARILAPGFLR
jgi:peptidoglycan/LPS O-acetylase OafA/YrhL